MEMATKKEKYNIDASLSMNTLPRLNTGVIGEYSWDHIHYRLWKRTMEYGDDNSILNGGYHFTQAGIDMFEFHIDATKLFSQLQKSNIHNLEGKWALEHSLVRQQ